MHSSAKILTELFKIIDHEPYSFHEIVNLEHDYELRNEFSRRSLEPITKEDIYSASFASGLYEPLQIIGIGGYYNHFEIIEQSKKFVRDVVSFQQVMPDLLENMIKIFHELNRDCAYGLITDIAVEQIKIIREITEFTGESGEREEYDLYCKDLVDKLQSEYAFSEFVVKIEDQPDLLHYIFNDPLSPSAWHISKEIAKYRLLQIDSEDGSILQNFNYLLSQNYGGEKGPLARASIEIVRNYTSYFPDRYLLLPKNNGMNDGEYVEYIFSLVGDGYFIDFASRALVIIASDPSNFKPDIITKIMEVDRRALESLDSKAIRQYIVEVNGGDQSAEVYKSMLPKPLEERLPFQSVRLEERLHHKFLDKLLLAAYNDGNNPHISALVGLYEEAFYKIGVDSWGEECRIFFPFGSPLMHETQSPGIIRCLVTNSAKFKEDAIGYIKNGAFYIGLDVLKTLISSILDCPEDILPLPRDLYDFCKEHNFSSTLLFKKLGANYIYYNPRDEQNLFEHILDKNDQSVFVDLISVLNFNEKDLSVLTRAMNYAIKEDKPNFYKSEFDVVSRLFESHPEILEFFVQHQILNLNSQSTGVDILKNPTMVGYSLLHLYAKNGDVTNLMKILNLFEHELDFGISTGKYTPLMLAVMNGSLKVVKLLEKFDPNFAKSGLEEIQDDTLAALAAQHGQNQILDWLLTKGLMGRQCDSLVDIALNNGQTNTAFHLMTKYGLDIDDMANIVGNIGAWALAPANDEAIKAKQAGFKNALEFIVAIESARIFGTFDKLQTQLKFKEGAEFTDEVSKLASPYITAICELEGWSEDFVSNFANKFEAMALVEYFASAEFITKLVEMGLGVEADWHDRGEDDDSDDGGIAESKNDGRDYAAEGSGRCCSA